MVLCNALGEKRRPEYLALLTSLITGLGIDMWMFLLADWVQPETIIGQSVCLAIGLIAGGLGIAINLQANFAPNPMDRSMQVVRNLTGLNIAISRALISIVLVLLAFMFNGPIGVGTILAALFTGVFIKFFMPYVEQFDKKHTNSQESLSS